MPRRPHRCLVPRVARLAALSFLVIAADAHALDLRVVGLSPTRAVISVNGSAPRTIPIGQKTEEGVRLVSIDGETATFEIDDKRRSLRIGQYVGSTGGESGQKVVLAATHGGHFLADSRINGAPVRMLVDTGATSIALSASDARRLGISYLNAPEGIVHTANGERTVWRVKLDSVSIGPITMNGVDAVILDGGLNMPLLGMSFLSRTNMQREGETLTLIKRY